MAMAGYTTKADLSGLSEKDVEKWCTVLTWQPSLQRQLSRLLDGKGDDAKQLAAEYALVDIAGIRDMCLAAYSDRIKRLRDWGFNDAATSGHGAPSAAAAVGTPGATDDEGPPPVVPRLARTRSTGLKTSSSEREVRRSHYRAAAVDVCWMV